MFYHERVENSSAFIMELKKITVTIKTNGFLQKMDKSSLILISSCKLLFWKNFGLLLAGKYQITKINTPQF